MATNLIEDPKYWDEVVASYEAMAAPFTVHYAREALAGLGIGPGTRLLDVATGTGAVALAAAQAGADVLAIDFSPGMVAKVLAHGHPRIAARQMDGQALDLPNAGFDVVASVFGVMLFPDWRAGLAEMARVCRPGGRAVVAVWSDPEGAAINLLLAQVRAELFPAEARPIPGDGMIALSDAGRLCRAMNAAGFTDPVVTETTHDFRLDAAVLDEADRMFGLIPLWSTLAPDQRVAVLAAIRSRLEDGAGVVRIPSTALIVRARRP